MNRLRGLDELSFRLGSFALGRCKKIPTHVATSECRLSAYSCLKLLFGLVNFYVEKRESLIGFFFHGKFQSWVNELKARKNWSASASVLKIGKVSSTYLVQKKGLLIV